MWPAPVQEAGRAGAARSAMWGIGKCRRFEVPTPSAARLFRNFKSKSGTRTICLPVPLSLPKFATECAAMRMNFGTKGTGISILQAPFMNPKFAIDLRQHCANFLVRAPARRHTLSAPSTGPSGCLMCGHLRPRALNRMARYAFAARRRMPRRPAFAGASAGPEQARRSPQGEDGDSNAGRMEREKCGLPADRPGA